MAKCGQPEVAHGVEAPTHLDAQQRIGETSGECRLLLVVSRLGEGNEGHVKERSYWVQEIGMTLRSVREELR